MNARIVHIRSTMKPTLQCCAFGLVLLAAPFFGMANTNQPAPDSLFAQANELYDQGQFAQAFRQYESLMADGYVTVETLFNAANAAFRNGLPGQAALLYRRAWYLNPRDADIMANLELAQERTGALKPSVNFLDVAIREFSHREWTILTKTAYWIALLATVIAVLIPASRRFAKPFALTTGCLALLGLGGWYYWNAWVGRQEAVVIIPKQTAMYEPREKATPFFAVPEGSIVYVEESFHSWVKIRAGQNTGWLPKNAIALVYSWKSDTID